MPCGLARAFSFYGSGFRAFLRYALVEREVLMAKRRGYEKTIRVYCSKCREEMDEKSVEFLNIEEDIMGADLMTFKCPVCKTEQKSNRRG